MLARHEHGFDRVEYCVGDTVSVENRVEADDRKTIGGECLGDDKLSLRKGREIPGRSVGIDDDGPSSRWRGSHFGNSGGVAEVFRFAGGDGAAFQITFDSTPGRFGEERAVSGLEKGSFGLEYSW